MTSPAHTLFFAAREWNDCEANERLNHRKSLTFWPSNPIFCSTIVIFSSVTKSEMNSTVKASRRSSKLRGLRASVPSFSLPHPLFPPFCSCLIFRAAWMRKKPFARPEFRSRGTGTLATQAKLKLVYHYICSYYPITPTLLAYNSRFKIAMFVKKSIKNALIQN